jgi:hypothetical protein
MTAPTGGYRVKRPLAATEIELVLDAVNRATTSAELIASVIRVIFTALLSDVGQRLEDLGPEHRINPDEYAIPQTQWDAVMTAITNRADEWGTAAQLALDLIDKMPAGYDDPAVPAPAIAVHDRRPYVHNIRVSRAAVDVVAACETHLASLAACYGATSPIYHHALTTWHRNLSMLFSMGLGADPRVTADGDQSLLVVTGSGYVYAITWHPARRRCTVDGCTTTIHDDGTIDPPTPGDQAAGHEHRPSYPIGAPPPGEWVAHS